MTVGRDKPDPNSDSLGPFAEDIFLNVFDFFGTLDTDGRVVMLKGSIFDQTKIDPQLLIGQRFSETVFWQASENTSKLVDDAIADSIAGHSSRLLVDFRISSDKKVALEMYVLPLVAAGRPRFIFVSGQQIASRQKTVGRYKTAIEELLFSAENAEIGIWYWDLKDGSIYATPKCNEVFGIPAYDKLTYERIIEAVHADDRNAVAESLKRAHLNGTRYNEEFRVQYPDGRSEWVSAEGKSFLDADGKPEKMTAVVRKVTEQKVAEEELTRVYDREKKARDEAEEANRSKDFFLAFVSHELRSPLNAILGWSKILLTREVDAETRRSALETIEKSARSQTKLINDLVDSARVASGKISLEFRPTNLFEVVKVSFISQKPAADTRNISMTFTSDSEQIIVFGDANRLQQVFVNLVSNAVKFTGPGGHVSVDIKTTEESAVVNVTDTGRGIEPEALPNIFRQFSQVEPIHDLNKGGLGLGLSIVKILVGKHGGTVAAESSGVGQGSAFTVTFPLKSFSPIAKDDTGKLKTNPLPLKNLRILVVEDDHDSREVLQLYLEKAGAVVHSLPSASDAMDVLERPGILPDIIISDLAMPEEDGYSLISRIRQLPEEQGGRLPAMALSAFASTESKRKALAAGFDFYCTKPFEPEQLTADILKLKSLRLQSNGSRS